MSSSSVAEPSKSVHPVVRIVERARWHEGAGVDQDHPDELSRQDLFGAFAKLGSLLVKLPMVTGRAYIALAPGSYG